MTTLHQLALKLGATDFGISTNKNKKYYVIYNNKKIHFGDNRYDDFTKHKDPERRKRYKLRASKIVNKNNQLTYKLKSSPNFWSYHLLW